MGGRRGAACAELCVPRRGEGWVLLNMYIWKCVCSSAQAPCALALMLQQIALRLYGFEAAWHYPMPSAPGGAMCPILGLLVQCVTHMLECIRRAILYIGLLQGVLFVSISQGARVHVLGTRGC